MKIAIVGSKRWNENLKSCWIPQCNKRIHSRLLCAPHYEAVRLIFSETRNRSLVQYYAKQKLYTERFRKMTRQQVRQLVKDLMKKQGEGLKWESNRK